MQLQYSRGCGMKEAEPDTMQRPPRDSWEGIFAGGLFFGIAYQGVLVTAITIISYILGHCFEVGYFEMPSGISPDGMTMAFLTMSICEIFHSFPAAAVRKGGSCFLLLCEKYLFIFCFLL